MNRTGAMSSLTVWLVFCLIFSGCGSETSDNSASASKSEKSSDTQQTSFVEINDIRDVKLSEYGLNNSVNLTYNGSMVEQMAELMGAKKVVPTLGEALDADAKGIQELVTNTEWSCIDTIDGKNIQTAVFFWDDGTGRYRRMNITDGQIIESAHSFNWQVIDDKLLILLKDSGEEINPVISGEEMTITIDGKESSLARNGEDYIIQGGEYSHSELSGKWKMVYCVSSSDNENLMNAGILSYLEFLEDGNVKFQFDFEFVRMFIKSGKYQLCEGKLMDGFLNKAWYCTLEGKNEASDSEGNCYCEFTLYGDYLLVHCSKDNDSTSRYNL